MNRTTIALLAASLTACASTSARRAHSVPEDASSGAPKQPACSATVDDDDQILVGGVPIGQNLTDLPFGFTDDAQLLTVHPLDDARILLAARPSWAVQGGAPRLGVLWEVPCAAPASRTERVRIEGADFGHSVLSLDRTRLYFTGPTGVSVLDLQTNRTSPVTSAPLLDEGSCWAAEGPDGVGRADDVVVGWAEEQPALVIWRGGPCGYEADWIGEELLVNHPDDPGRRAIVDRAPVSSISADSKGILWLGDAGQCDEPGITDPQTPDAAWRSDDGGATWTKVPLGTDEEPEPPTAAYAVLPGAEPGTLLVLTGLCTSSAVGVYGGSVLTSRDGGATFSKMPMPPAIQEADEASGAAVHAVELTGGTISRVRIWWEDVAFETEDGGATWSRLESPPLPPTPPKRLERDGTVLLATRNGLLKKAAGTAPAERLFPPGERPASQ